MDLQSTILWRRLDLPGHEVAELAAVDAGWHLTGIVLLAHDGAPCRLEYEIECDPAWNTRRVRVHGHVHGNAVELGLDRTADRTWYVNGQPVSALHGCADVDLGFSPSTNLLPIRRLRLPIGSCSFVHAAWVRFPELTVEVLDQVYTRVSKASYRYESGGGVFQRELRVNAHGFVLEYPGFWHAEAATFAFSSAVLDGD